MNPLNQAATAAESPLTSAISRLESLSREYEELVAIMGHKFSVISNSNTTPESPNKSPQLTATPRQLRSQAVNRLESLADSFNSHIQQIRILLEQLDI